MHPVSRVALWALLGAVVAVPLDALHVWSGVISCGDRGIEGLDWTAVPLFAGAGVLVGVTHRSIAIPLGARLKPGAMKPTTTLAALLGAMALVLSYGSSSFLHHAPIVALALYVASWLAIVAGVDEAARPALVLFSLGAAIVGPGVEMLIASTGSFFYTRPDLLGFPIWLPAIYLNAGAAVHLLDRRLLHHEPHEVTS